MKERLEKSCAVLVGRFEHLECNEQLVNEKLVNEQFVNEQFVNEQFVNEQPVNEQFAMNSSTYCKKFDIRMNSP